MHQVCHRVGHNLLMILMRKLLKLCSRELTSGTIEENAVAFRLSTQKDTESSCFKAGAPPTTPIYFFF